ncbi:hypothetical protein [Amycolatopsis azurea]|uniref:Excreted virulence factor EspC (Type VII ESX diderm) n=1 Tax=Amycolatopsis azurea DSM 43854 TaxID=1238180 RepID=A0ABX3J7H8_9PSEU|nr:hypothetical protein [Amycolatopsis azurea]OOC03646.1 hypothetical protein B0293_25530 [Amycolatopsis azurea DSM 43854]
MTGFEADPKALRDAVDQAKRAAGIVRELDLERVAALSGALTGSESAKTAATLGPHWESSISVWAGGVDSYAASLTTAASAYRAQDGVGEQGFDGAGGR